MKKPKEADPLLDAMMSHALSEHRAGRVQAAAQIYRQVIAENPAHPSALNLLGAILMENGGEMKALDLSRKAAMLAPAYRAAQTNFGTLLYKLHIKGHKELAAKEAKIWSKRQPKNEVARHWAAALGGKSATPERMPDVLVRNVFDGFASQFESTLEGLGYRAPELLGALLAERLKGREGSLAILDAGCGTGLMGPHLRPWAALLDGVDLSAGMLEQARARGLYDHLAAMELTGFLAASRAAYDLIAAADVLCYFGALEEVFSKARAALKPGGRIVFTVEAGEAKGFTLGASGRYAHGEAYVRETLAGSGFNLEHLAPDHARTEAGKPVPCLAVVAERG
jgi:predicted TPR repeat methyltransferase